MARLYVQVQNALEIDSRAADTGAPAKCEAGQFLAATSRHALWIRSETLTIGTAVNLSVLEAPAGGGALGKCDEATSKTLRTEPLVKRHDRVTDWIICVLAVLLSSRPS